MATSIQMTTENTHSALFWLPKDVLYCLMKNTEPSKRGWLVGIVNELHEISEKKVERIRNVFVEVVLRVMKKAIQRMRCGSFDI